LLNKIKEFFNGEEYIVVANIPYSITSHFIRIMLETTFAPIEMVLMIQKEVATRICAKPGDESMLSVSCKFYSEPEILFLVNRKSFYPSPIVDSAIIRFKRKKTFLINDRNKINKFFKFVKVGFSNKRKMLSHNISSTYIIDKNKIKENLKSINISENTRAQDLSVDDWVNLFGIVMK
jgi:16S rRNA (adenine1518-N6/adenine1519-N6)-dimethyltransferase